MGVHILANRADDAAALYDSVTMTAFGPVFGNEEQADAFLKYCAGDPRSYDDSQLASEYSGFVMDSVCECGHVRVDECPWCEDGEPRRLGTYRASHTTEDGTVDCDLDYEASAGERFICPNCRYKADKNRTAAAPATQRSNLS